MTAESTARPDVPSGFSVTPAYISAPDRSELNPATVQAYGTLAEIVYGLQHVRSLQFVNAPDTPVRTHLGSLDAKSLPVALGEALGATISPDRVCVLDLLGLNDLRGTKQQVVAAAISASVAADDMESPHVLVLLDSIPAPEDPLRLVSLTTNVVLVAQNGEVIGIDDEPAPDPRAVSSAINALAGESVETRLRQKLIRVPGYFSYRDEDGTSLFARNWYDGRHCVHEVQELILRSCQRAETDAIVICDSSHSPWLTEAAFAAAQESDLPIWDVEEAEDRSVELDHAARILLIAPVCHTGQTIARMWERLKTLPNVATVRPTAIVSTMGDVATDSRRSVAGISVHYWVYVVQHSVASDDTRHQPDPESSVDKVGHGHLTVFEFHDLLRLCGTRDEDHVPDHRGTAGDVPDTKTMLTQFGPWLATRLLDSLRWPTRNNRDFVLLYPDEPIVDDSEPVSETLAARLRSLYSVETIAVPRDDWLIREKGTPGNAADLVDRFDRCTDHWAERLRGHRDSTAVLLDEFVSSGETLKLLAEIADAAGLRVPTTALAMLDLRPLGAEHTLDIDVRSLYRLPLRSGSPTA